MGINKIFIYILTAMVLSGCVQTTAMLGPGLTLVSTGNVVQAGINYSANKVIEDETGKTPTEHFKGSINKKEIKKLEINKIKKKFIILVKSNLKKTRKKIINLKD